MGHGAGPSSQDIVTRVRGGVSLSGGGGGGAEIRRQAETERYTHTVMGGEKIGKERGK